LALVLASKGYDVWIGNNRGNKHSRNHRTLDPNKDAQFWEYSFHEMGLYDVPALLNKIKMTTGVDKVTYIGHSQGTSQMFAGMASKPDYYKSSLNGFIALGPVVYMRNIGACFLDIAAKTHIDNILSLFKINELLANQSSAEQLEIFLCQNFGILCTNLLDLVSDRNIADDDLKRFLVFVGHFPSGSSSRSVSHFANNIRSGNFADPDGKLYDLSAIRDIPIGLFVGADDRLATVNDNRLLKLDLEKSNSLKFYKEYPNMGHVTFFLNKDNVYVDDVVTLLDKFHQA
jgi:lysosomal acid lipase/cholesteryl ester hydrolase